MRQLKFGTGDDDALPGIPAWSRLAPCLATVVSGELIDTWGYEFKRAADAGRFPARQVDMRRGDAGQPAAGGRRYTKCSGERAATRCETLNASDRRLQPGDQLAPLALGRRCDFCQLGALRYFPCADRPCRPLQAVRRIPP